MNIELIKKIAILLNKLFPFIINDIKFSPKWKITIIELRSCFIDALKTFTFTTSITGAIFLQYINEKNWPLMLLNIGVFLFIFFDKFINKLTRDGSQINYDIHKDLLGQLEDKQ